MTITDQKIIDEFTLGYIYSALWWLNKDYDISDIYSCYLSKIIDECRQFQDKNKELLKEIYSQEKNGKHEILPAHLGNDFWLFRNDFSPEFMFRIPIELAQHFEQSCRKMGKQELVVDDDILRFLFDAHINH